MSVHSYLALASACSHIVIPLRSDYRVVTGADQQDFYGVELCAG
jgi:hypothetical protein